MMWRGIPFWKQSYKQLVGPTNQKNPSKIAYVKHPLTDSMESDVTPVVTEKDYKRGFW